ncbi:beta-lactamase-like protein [Powellomyces hirtus]|nr:beta-lactamase-like protein [Powellomyces hirtus]
MHLHSLLSVIFLLAFPALPLPSAASPLIKRSTGGHIPPYTIPFTPLPAPPSRSATVSVTLLHLGHLATKRGTFIYDPPHANETIRVPCWGWVIEKNGRRYLWDLGLRYDVDALPKAVRELLGPNGLFASHVRQGDAYPEILKRVFGSRVTPTKRDISGIILSHPHMDHYGALDAFDKRIPVFVGNGTMAFINGGDAVPGGLDSFPSRYLEGRKFVEVGQGEDRKEWIGKRSRPIGAFDRCWDFFGDGSMWLCDAPGHTPGHLVALLRVSTSPSTYLLLGGDSAHAQALYSPPPRSATEIDRRQPIGSLTFNGQNGTMHLDLQTAYVTIARLGRMEMENNVMVITAHEVELEKLGIAPGKLLKGWERWSEREWKAAKLRD